MAQIQGGETFSIGQQFTATRANNHVNGATLLPGAISDQPDLAANSLEAGDKILVLDTSVLPSPALREASVGDVLNSGLPVTLGSPVQVKANGAGAVAIQALESTPGDGATIKIQGVPGITTNEQVVIGDPLVTANNIAAPDIVLSGTMLAQFETEFSAKATFNDKVDFDATSAIKLPVGTTGQRPVTPVKGDIRYNDTIGAVEVYDGTLWEEVGGGPFDATGGNTIIAPDTTVVSGVSFTSADGYLVTVTHSGHSVYPGQTIKFTTAVAGYSGEFTVYEADASTFKFFMVTIAAPNSGTGDYQKAGNYKCHIFTSSGTFNAGPKDGYVEVVVVGGGAGAKTTFPGIGGCAGGFAYVSRYKVNANEVVNVNIGSGGTGATGQGSNMNGTASVFGSVTAYGGTVGTGASSGGNSIGSSGYLQVGEGGAGASRAGNFDGVGGPGVSTNITGITTYYSYGGAATYGSNVALIPLEARGNNSGKGGDGYPMNQTPSSAAGKNGIVIVRYPYWLP